MDQDLYESESKRTFTSPQSSQNRKYQSFVFFLLTENLIVSKITISAL